MEIGIELVYKVTAQNTFAVPLITPTIGVLDWTRHEIDQLDVKTRKVSAMTGSMHTNSDINRLYLTRKKGCRGLQCIADIFDTRLVHPAQHVEDEKEKGNWLMNAVWQHEQNELIKVAEGITSFYLKECQEHLENVKDAIKNKAQEMHERNREERKVHAYLKSKLIQDENIDHTQTNK